MLAALLALGAAPLLALAQSGVAVDQGGVQTPLVQEAKVDWGTDGITLLQFRKHFAGRWDAVSATVGKRRQDTALQAKRDELVALVRSAHQKLGLEGTSDPTDVYGAASDWSSDFQTHYTWAEASEALRQRPQLLHESGHAGQALFSPVSQSTGGALPADLVTDSERVELLGQAGKTLPQTTTEELARLRKLRQRLLTVMSVTYGCAIWPSPLPPGSPDTMQSCGTADSTRYSEQLAKIEHRLYKLQLAAKKPLPVSAFSFNSADLFAEADADHNHLLSLPEIQQWAHSQARSFGNVANSPLGKPNASPLWRADGYLSKQPVRGSCSGLVQSSCPGTVGEACEACFKRVWDRVGGALESGSKYSVCPTWAHVAQACTGGDIASDRWRGISAQARWVMEARERAHQQPSSAELLETKPLGDDASAYVNRVTEKAAVAARARLRASYMAQH